MNPQSSLNALPTTGEHLLRAPVFAPGIKSPEEIGGHLQGDILVKLSASGVPIVGAIATWPSKTVPYVIEPRFSKYFIKEHEICSTITDNFRLQ